MNTDVSHSLPPTLWRNKKTNSSDLPAIIRNYNHQNTLAQIP